MGLLITLNLITWNVYGSVAAPPSRGFSYIELWITGIQINILFAILEYACILALKRTNIGLKIGKLFTFTDLDGIVKILDLISFIVSFVIFSIFNVMYWFFQ